ncbi:DNA-binding protein [Haematobacter massiliensis]|uniref:DNA-binding protein n=1 Tax=Haematobacter massiliensis TaxID=195105 RepID=A0A086Y0F6_9RHOB|nr:DNA-binding protein [Haematobacter massiliensis]KFI27756.1 DNA-binding protein [Haematobacter massiliensis]OWJ82740.1 transcriptional regulator [Haematobacter massiliensis]
MTKVGERLLRAAREANEIAAGRSEPASLYVPADVDVKAIRTSLDLSQEDFATEFGFSIHQIRDWEQKRHRPLDGMRAYLIIIEQAPDRVREILRETAAKQKIHAA